GLVADAQLQLIDRFGGHEAHEAVRPGEDLDDRRDPVAFDAGHDAGEAIAGGLGDDRPVRRSPAALAEQPADLGDRDGALAAGRTNRGQLPVSLPAAERVDAHAEELGSLADPDVT